MGRWLSMLKVSIRQIKAARALLGWSQADLASHSKIGIATIKRLEAEDDEAGGRASTWEALVASLEYAGVEFLSKDDGGAGVRLVRRRHVSRRSTPLPKSG